MYYLAIGLLIGVIFIYLCSNSSNAFTSGDKIGILVRQAARWTTAAAQDENAMIAVLHANYGAGYLWALKDIATDAEIERAVPGVNMKKFTKEVTGVQDQVTRRMIKLCPAYGPKPSYLTTFSGEGR